MLDNFLRTKPDYKGFAINFVESLIAFFDVTKPHTDTLIAKLPVMKRLVFTANF